jgi:hypothetical protein
MVTLDSQSEIEAYASLVNGLGDEPEYADTEALLALIARDSIEEDWEHLTGAQQSQVKTIDDELVQRASVVAEILPNPNFTDRRHWWWFLNEGPQVRKKARQLEAA